MKGWKTAGTALTVLVVSLQVLGPKLGRPEESGPPQINEEIAKQEKIYRSRGSDVPSGYVTNRALSDYVELLPYGFCEALARLGSSDRWLDIGAGAGQAILDYHEAAGDAARAAKCTGYRGRARAVAMSIEDRRTEKWQQRAAILGEDRIRYISGKRLRDYSRDELGTFQVITDVYGGFSYTEDLSRFIEKVLSLLDIGGVFYTMLQAVHLEHPGNKPGSRYQTVLVDAAGQNVKVCSWLKKATCVKVGCESRSDWDTPTELINVQKVCAGVSVPRLKLLHYEAGNPPRRRFELAP